VLAAEHQLRVVHDEEREDDGAQSSVADHGVSESGNGKCAEFRQFKGQLC
jgi:hypothetical protein